VVQDKWTLSVKRVEARQTQPQRRRSHGKR
jgi:hypothetical protein